MPLRAIEVVIDCADHDTVIGFWSEALVGWRRREVNEQYVALVPPDDDRAAGPGPSPFPLLFQKVPEAKVAKNRVHVDFRADDREAEVARLVGLGASILAEHCLDAFCWTVLADPEGNEFCVS